LDEDEWVGAASSGAPWCEQRPSREQQQSWRTVSVAAVTGAKIVGTTAEIAARTGGIDAEVRKDSACILLSRRLAVGREIRFPHVVMYRRTTGEELT
jgi:hypothetical protein